MDQRVDMVISIPDNETGEAVVLKKIQSPVVIPEIGSEVFLVVDASETEKALRHFKVESVSHSYNEAMNRLHHNIAVQVSEVK